MSTLLESIVFIQVFLSLFTNNVDSCSIGIPVDEAIIDDVSLLKSSRNKVLVESSDGDCVIWKVGSSNSEYAACSDYKSSKLYDWSTGDEDPTSTSVTDLISDDNITYSSIEMTRNDESITINLLSNEYNNLSLINKTLWKHWMYLTLNDFNITFILLGTSNGPSNLTIGFAIKFQTQESNTNYDVFDIELIGDIRSFYIWQMQYDQTYDSVYIWSQLKMVQLPVEWSSCDRWLFFNYMYDNNTRSLSLKQVSRDDYIDDRDTVFIGYEWFYSTEIRVTYYTLEDDGTITTSQESYKIEFVAWYQELWWLWLIIVLVVVIGICVGCYFYKKRHTENETFNENDRPKTGLASSDGIQDETPNV